MFDKKGLIVIDKDKVDEDDLIMIALEAGAEDVQSRDDSFEIITAPQDFGDVKNAVQEAEIETILAEVSMIPQTTVKLDGKDALRLLKLMESLEEHDDVQNVYANFDIPDDIIEQAA
jgi:transcriptional/translational regulatory protein YebC/TACO1